MSHYEVAKDTDILGISGCRQDMVLCGAKDCG